MTKQKLLEMIELLERLRDLRELWIDEPTVDPTIEMALFLMRRHLSGLLTTPTSLAQSANVPYTTATRRITRMQEQGLIDLHPRTKSGKSFSVHPSSKLISKVTSYLMATRAAISATSVTKSGARSTRAAAASANVIRPPSMAPKKLGFGEGLTVLVLDDPAYTIGKPLRRELSYLMGGKVQFIETSIDNLRAEILTNSERKSSMFDVVAVDLPMIAEFANRGILSPLDDVAGKSDLISEDFVSAAWRGAMVDRKQFAIPILINPQLLFYRKDLFAQSALQPPQTMAQVLDAAAKLHEPNNLRFGVSWTGARGAPVGQAFIQFLADFDQPIFELERSVGGYKTDGISPASLTPMIDTDRGYAAAEFMIKLLEFSPSNTLQMSWNDQVNLLREGQVAMSFEWASRAAQLAGFPSVGDVGFLPHPIGELPNNITKRSSVSPIGGFAFGIPSNIKSDRLQTAWNAIEWLSSPEIIKLLVQYGGHITPRISVGADPDVQQRSPVISAVDGMAKRGQIRLWPRPPVSNFTSIVDILGVEIHTMLCGDQSISQALKRSQERAEAIS